MYIRKTPSQRDAVTKTTSSNSKASQSARSGSETQQLRDRSRNDGTVSASPSRDTARRRPYSYRYSNPYLPMYGRTDTVSYTADTCYSLHASATLGSCSRNPQTPALASGRSAAECRGGGWSASGRRRLRKSGEVPSSSPSWPPAAAAAEASRGRRRSSSSPERWRRRRSCSGSGLCSRSLAIEALSGRRGRSRCGDDRLRYVRR